MKGGEEGYKEGRGKERVKEGGEDRGYREGLGGEDRGGTW